MKYLVLFFYLIAAPCLLGLPWVGLLPKKKGNRVLASFPVGFFVEMGLFQLLAFPFAYFKLRFSQLCVVYTAIVMVCSVLALIYGIVYKPILLIVKRFTPWEWVYFTAFIFLLGIQSYNGYCMDATYMSFDDAYYVTYASDAVYSDYIGLLNTNSGLAGILNVYRTIQSSLLFPGLLAYESGISTTVICRTVLQIFYIVLAYSVYAYMSSVLYDKRENRLIFLILMCVLYIFGYYSHYSVTFRLLGPNYQGKAIAATCFFPLLLTLYMEMLGRKYKPRFGVLLMVMSAASGSLSMFGAAGMILNSVLIIVVSYTRKKRIRKQFLYIPWACILPMLYCTVYYIYRYYKW